MKEEISELLSNGKIQKLKENHYIGEDNIFSILSVENKEIFHCRFLKYIIQNNWNSFAKEILFADTGELEFCQCEYPCTAIENCLNSKMGRMDLYFEAENFNVAIEVKWHAGEQPLQLLRYHQYLKNNDKKVILVFLTLDGHEAENISCSEKNCRAQCVRKLEKKDYRCCSFKKISVWIDGLLNETDINKSLLEQYNDVLKEEIDRMSTEKELIEIINRVELFDAADAIARSMDNVRNIIRSRFFEALTRKIEGYDPSFSVQVFFKDGKRKYINIQNGQNEEIRDASAQYWLVTQDEKVFRFGYATNLYCGIGNSEKDWVYITPDWFRTENSGEKNYNSEKSPADKKIDVKNLAKNGSQKENAVVRWYFDKDNKEKEIENVVCNMLRYFGLK